MTNEEIKVMLEKHKHWLDGDCEGCEEMRTDLRYADLRYADLRGADLRGAILIDADLRGADLRGAILIDAVLIGADLSYASLIDAYLRGASLIDADLRGADLRGAGLRDADLRYAKNVPFIPIACPDAGSFIAYKKADCKIVELEIPSDARRCSATTRKCRCDKAKVLGIYDFERNLLDIKEVTSDRGNLVYKVGEMVYPDSYDEDRWNECSNGIHFFVNFQEAVDY